MAKVQLNKPDPIQLIRMHNRLKEFEELLLDNTLLKVSSLRGQKSQMEGDTLPSLLLNPLEGPTMLSCGKLRLEGRS